MPELHEYGNVALVVDLLTGAQCVSFVEALSKRGLAIADREVAFEAAGSVEVQKQPVRNWWMEEAGSIFTFGQNKAVAATHEPLVKIGSPYFPDAYEAVKHWGELRKHGGSTDQTNSKVVVLDRYVGALRSRITNSLDLPPDMSFAVTKLKDKLVVVIRVAQSKHRIAIGEEGILYVRKSGTNKKLAPNDWPPKERDRPYGI